jgi:hypothetical protein
MYNLLNHTYFVFLFFIYTEKKILFYINQKHCQSPNPRAAAGFAGDFMAKRAKAAAGDANRSANAIGWTLIKSKEKWIAVI